MQGVFAARPAFFVLAALGIWACSSAESGDPSPAGASGAGGRGTSGSSGSSTSGGGTSGGVSEDAGSSSGSTSGDVKDSGSGKDGATPPGCYDYASFTPKAVSFAADVMPLFQARCASCHGNPAAGTYYGSNAALVYSKLLTGTPVQAPQLKFVAPNDPLRSYMLAKIEYANPGGTCSVVQCTAPGCNLFAPPGAMLPESERAVLRSWVMTGAMND